MRNCVMVQVITAAAWPSFKASCAPFVPRSEVMKTNAKYVELTPALYDYMVRQRSEAADPILKSLRVETAALGDVSRMLISEEQGSFFTLLVRALAIRSAIEIGTFTGYSSICIARGLPAKGRLVC